MQEPNASSQIIVKSPFIVFVSIFCRYFRNGVCKVALDRTKHAIVVGYDLSQGLQSCLEVLRPSIAFFGNSTYPIIMIRAFHTERAQH